VRKGQEGMVVDNIVAVCAKPLHQRFAYFVPKKWIKGLIV
jgi:hypothetical protein